MTKGNIPPSSQLRCNFSYSFNTIFTFFLTFQFPSHNHHIPSHQETREVIRFKATGNTILLHSFRCKTGLNLVPFWISLLHSSAMIKRGSLADKNVTHHCGPFLWESEPRLDLWSSLLHRNKKTLMLEIHSLLLNDSQTQLSVSQRH